MKIDKKRRLSGVLGAVTLTVGLIAVPASGAFAQDIVYKTYCGVQ